MFIVPANIVFVSTLVNGLLSKSVLLSCVSDGIPTPTVEWKKGDRIYSWKGKTSSYRVLDNGTLVINHVSMSDEGRYRCIASNRGGQDKRTVDLDVQCMYSASIRIYISCMTVVCYNNVCTVGPSISTSLEDEEVLVGTDATFTCTAVGDPAPTLDWHKNGLMIRDGNRFEVSDNGHVLTIRQTTPNDAGVYTCVAKNTVIHRKTDIELDAKSSANLTVIGISTPRDIRGNDCSHFYFYFSPCSCVHDVFSRDGCERQECSVILLC